MQQEGEPVAIKKLRQTFKNHRMVELAYREILILNRLKHPNIINLHDSYISGEKL